MNSLRGFGANVKQFRVHKPRDDGVQDLDFSVHNVMSYVVKWESTIWGIIEMKRGKREKRRGEGNGGREKQKNR